MSANMDILLGLLPIAVDNVIDVVRHESWEQRLDRLQVMKKRWADEGRECFSEALLCRTTKGASAIEFRDLACTLAVLSFFPGGVTFAGLHWETSP